DCKKLLSNVRLRKTTPRLVLLSTAHPAHGDNFRKICLMGSDGKPRWDMQYPREIVAARWIGNRLLIAESSGVGVYGLEGEVIWRKDAVGGKIVSCRLLPNGNLLVATERRVTEYTAAGEAHALWKSPELGPDVVVDGVGRFRTDLPICDALRLAD